MKRAALAFLVACSGKSALDNPESTAIEPPKDAITKQVENGPVKVVEKVWPAKPTLGEPIYMRLEIDAAPGVQVTAPFQEAGDQRMGRFRVPEFKHESRRNANGGQHEDQTYTLEAPSSGKHRIPPLRFEMIDARADRGSNASTQEVLTEEVPLDIAPVKTEAIGATLKDPAGHIDPDVGGTPWMKILLAVSAAAVLGSGGVLLLRAQAARKKVAARRDAYDEAVRPMRPMPTVGSWSCRRSCAAISSCATRSALPS